MSKRKTNEQPLDARKQTILKAIVWDYVQTAEPVGSETLVQRYELGVKPATVRNEMAEMAEMGYLYQPHTSAGRVPSDTGYRYYVDRLMARQPLSPEAEENASRLPQMQGELIQLLAETCKMLAKMTRYMTIATTLKNGDVTLKQVVVSPVSAEKMLLVLVFSNGHIENRWFDAPDGCSLSDIGKAAEMLNAQAAGKPLKSLINRETRRIEPEMERAAGEIFERAMKLIRTLAREHTRGKVIFAGEMHMLEQPEFQRDIDRLEALLRALEEGQPILNSLERSVQNNKVTVVIGEENPLEPMQNCSLIASRFYIGSQEAGTVGVLGPTRMRYDQAVPAVERMAHNLSEMLTWLIED